ncbi:stage V sporulation protein AA, partial [Bacillus sp. ZZQ-131]
VQINLLGSGQTLVEIIYEKKKAHPVFFGLVWLLLFIGAALAIIYFHEDVSMQQVHQRLYYMITGEFNAQPLLFQIPYSLGLGLGMVLFFNHVFQKRINEEPSPLEVEMFQYQQSLDQYVIVNENKDNMKQLADD